MTIYIRVEYNVNYALCSFVVVRLDTHDLSIKVAAGEGHIMCQ
jgi:hypothetical protein